MTDFNESNLQALERVRHTHRYSQIWAQTYLKARYDTEKITSSDWKKHRPFISDPRWAHALKLGIWTEDEFAEGGPDIDDTVAPGDVIIDLPTNTASAQSNESDQEAVILPIDETEKSMSTDSGNPDENTTRTHPIDQDNEVDIPTEDEVQDGVGPDLTDEGNVSNDEKDDQSGGSSFVSWLKTLPKVAGFSDKSAEQLKSREADSNKPIEENKKVNEVAANEIATRQKKKKVIEEEEGEMPYQDLVVSSMELGEDISSEPLAQLLLKHGHPGLAKKIYHRLMKKYPEKSSYFAAQIEDLNEEEE